MGHPTDHEVKHTRGEWEHSTGHPVSREIQHQGESGRIKLGSTTTSLESIDPRPRGQEQSEKRGGAT